MKSFFLLVLLAFAGNAAAQQAAVVTGFITEPTHDSVRISYYTNMVNFERKTFAALLDEDGGFSIAMPLNKPVAAFLEHKFEIIELYLQPGDNLEILFDAEDVDESLTFKGEGSVENKCIAEISQYQDDQDFHSSKKSMFADDKAYLKVVNDKFGWQEKAAEKYLKKNTVSEAFKSWMRSEIKFGSALQKLQFTELRGTIVKLDDPYKVSPDFYSFIAETEAYPNPDLSSLCYINYKQELVNYEYRKTVTNSQNPDYYSGKYNLAKTMLDGEAEAIVCGRMVTDAFKHGQVDYAMQILEDYKKQPGSKAYYALVESGANFHKPLARGSKAPPLPLVDVNGNKIDLSSLKGKAVYLYFYTLGCGSCQLEIVGARQLAERFEGEEIEFLFVSVDHDRATWKKVISRRPWPGIVGQTVDSAATTHNYRLHQYPAALIIDADGKIYDRAAKRLNSLELQGNLEAVLKEKRKTVQGHLLPKDGK